MRPVLLTALLAVLACSGSAKDDSQPEADGATLSVDGAIADASAAEVADAMESIDASTGGVGDLCGEDGDGLLCGTGLACCYPCGIAGCEFTCTEACSDDEPGCSNGCIALP